MVEFIFTFSIALLKLVCKASTASLMESIWSDIPLLVLSTLSKTSSTASAMLSICFKTSSRLTVTISETVSMLPSAASAAASALFAMLRPVSIMESNWSVTALVASIRLFAESIMAI